MNLGNSSLAERFARLIFVVRTAPWATNPCPCEPLARFTRALFNETKGKNISTVNLEASKMGTGLRIFTWVHVAISLVAIGSGFVVIIGLLKSQSLEHWTLVFLATTVATSVTGFGFPVRKFLPSHAFGILSLVLLTAAILAYYSFDLAGAWRWIYVVGAVLSLYLNVFVLIVQAYQKVPMLNALAPTQSERPFLLTHLVMLAIFLVVAIAAVIRFYP